MEIYHEKANHVQLAGTMQGGILEYRLDFYRTVFPTPDPSVESYEDLIGVRVDDQALGGLYKVLKSTVAASPAKYGLESEPEFRNK